MKNSLKEEFKSHLIDTVNDRFDEYTTDFEELHHTAFNETPYIIGNGRANDWLKKHDITSWDAIAKVVQWENDTFGEITLPIDGITPETIVNKYVYAMTEDLCYELENPFKSNKEEMIKLIKLL